MRVLRDAKLNSKIDENDERVYWHWFPYIIAGKNNAINLLCTMKTLLKYNAHLYPILGVRMIDLWVLLLN